MGNLYFDERVFRFAARHQLGLLLASHCPAKGSEDIDVVPEYGIGRALLTALDQLGRESRHPELSRARVIYFGFSGAGSLTARMVNYTPDRTIAAVEYAPGQGDPVGMDTVTLKGNALYVPQLIIVNGSDTVVGTARPYAYFEQYRKLGAPLTFLIQNQTPHCCVANVVPLVLEWLGEVVHLRKPAADGRPLRRIDHQAGWIGILNVRDSGAREELWHAKIWNAVGAEIGPATHQPGSPDSGLELPRAPTDAQVPRSGTLLPAWLPSRRFAGLWQVFARQEAHPLTPLE